MKLVLGQLNGNGNIMLGTRTYKALFMGLMLRIAATFEFIYVCVFSNWINSPFLFLKPLLWIAVFTNQHSDCNL